MSARDQMVRDAALHMSDEVREVFFRQLTVLRAAGYSTGEATAVVLDAVDRLAFVAIGLALSAIPPANRESAAGEVIGKISQRLCDQIPELIGRVRQSEIRVAERTQR